MPSVKMPRTVIATVVLCLFAVVLYSLRRYGNAGEADYALLAVGAGTVCLALIGGLIYANYESYHPRASQEQRSFNGTCH